MTTEYDIEGCDVCGADRRHCNCQQGRTSVFSNTARYPGTSQITPPYHERACAVNRCRPHACLCKCHRDSTRESAEDFLAEDFKKEANQ